MASLRKKYQPQLGSPHQDDAPVLSPPEVSGAKLPDPVETKPVEPLTESSPAEEAAKTALRQRLKEMENAEALQRQQQQPQHAEQPQAPQQQQAMPAAVEKWLRENPRYMDPNDAIAQAEINLAAMKCARDNLTWDHPDFIPTIERHLGIAPAGNGHDKPTPQPANVARALPSAPPRQQARPMSAAPVSAPPTREVPSYSTGRSPRYRAPLTKDELEIAAASGQTPEQYQQQKERMLRMKAAGEMQ